MSLPEPNFIDRDPEAITAEIVAMYEEKSKKTLYPAQIDRIMIDIIAYRETLIRTGIQEAAKQNLLAFAVAPMIDYLGQLVGVDRLPAQSSRSFLRFAIPTPLLTELVIDVGTRAESNDGSVAFETEEVAVIPAGQLFVDISSICTVAGVIGNDWQPGQISNLVDAIGNDDIDVTVTNRTITSGGDEEEDNDHLRDRIRLAPESFSTAGPELAYEFHVKSVHQSIIAVGIRGPELEIVDGELVSNNEVPAGCVFLYPLTKTGLPDENLLSLVRASLTGKKKRPLTDYVQVFAPTPVDFTIDAGIELDPDTDVDSTLALAITAAEAYKAAQQSDLAKDIVPRQVIKLLQPDGVHDVTLLQPTEKRVLARNEWARCVGINVVVTGVDDEQ